MVRFRAKDRRIFVAALHRKWFVKLAEILGAPELAEDPRFASQRLQAEHADELIAAIEAKLAARPAAGWEPLFVEAGLPTSVVRKPEELLANSRVQERGVLEAVDFPDLDRRVNLVGAGFKFAHDQPKFHGHVPRLGEHTEEVLAELNGVSAGRSNCALPVPREGQVHQEVPGPPSPCLWVECDLSDTDLQFRPPATVTCSRWARLSPIKFAAWARTTRAFDAAHAEAVNPGETNRLGNY